MAQRTQFILLGFLKSTGPQSGYELKKHISETTAYFWTESFGAIYPALHKLEAEGLVSSKDSGEKRKVIQYSITEAGEAVLREWLAKPPEFQKPRHELLLKLLFSEGCPKEQSRGHIEERLRFAEGRLKLLQQIADDLQFNHPNDPALPYWLMTVNHGLIHARATIEWCQQCLKTLEKI